LLRSADDSAADPTEPVASCAGGDRSSGYDSSRRSRHIAAWRFADYEPGCDWDAMTDALKLRAARLTSLRRANAMLLRLFELRSGLVG
jgi:hypothetical protein